MKSEIYMGGTGDQSRIEYHLNANNIRKMDDNTRPLLCIESLRSVFFFFILLRSLRYVKFLALIVHDAEMT